MGLGKENRSWQPSATKIRIMIEIDGEQTTCRAMIPGMAALAASRSDASLYEESTNFLCVRPTAAGLAGGSSVVLATTSAIVRAMNKIAQIEEELFIL